MKCKFYCGAMLVVLLASLVGAQDLTVNKTDTPITVNGLADDAAWALVEENVVDNAYVGVPDDNIDSEGYFRMLWDDTYVYFICNVFDDILNEDSPGADEHDESFDMFFDPWLDGGDAPQEDDVLLTLEWSSTGVCKKSGAKGGFVEFDTTGVIAMCTETGDGYMIEAAIPLADLQIAGGDDFGFDLRINDDDDGSSRDTQVAWHVENLGDWNRPAALATLALSGVLVSVADQPVTPAVYSLAQNYPNPFNPSTTIAYTLAKTGQVRLAVYDLLGTEVAVLANGVQAEGNHTITFSGAGLSSGLYFYKLESEQGVFTKKMILMQ